MLTFVVAGGSAQAGVATGMLGVSFRVEAHGCVFDDRPLALTVAEQASGSTLGLMQACEREPDDVRPQLSPVSITADRLPAEAERAGVTDPSRPVQPVQVVTITY